MRRRPLLNFGGINRWQGVASGRNPDWLIAQHAGPSIPDFNLQRLRERWRGIGAAFGQKWTFKGIGSVLAQSSSQRVATLDLGGLEEIDFFAQSAAFPRPYACLAS